MDQVNRIWFWWTYRAGNRLHAIVTWTSAKGSKSHSKYFDQFIRIKLNLQLNAFLLGCCCVMDIKRYWNKKKNDKTNLHWYWNPFWFSWFQWFKSSLLCVFDHLMFRIGGNRTKAAFDHQKMYNTIESMNKFIWWETVQTWNLEQFW